MNGGFNGNFPLLNGSFNGPKKQLNMEVLEVLIGKLPCKWWSFVQCQSCLITEGKSNTPNATNRTL